MDVKKHYDLLIKENNDPFSDTPELKAYMEKWDGKMFLDALLTGETKNVLEIGVGTGRLAFQVAPFCKHLTGIDISPETVKRAKVNLERHKNITLICGDFLSFYFEEQFDVIYSSLTSMHFEDKKEFLEKVDGALQPGGIFVLSIDKNRDGYIDMGTRKLKIYPDTPENIKSAANATSMKVADIKETEHAYIIIFGK